MNKYNCEKGENMKIHGMSLVRNESGKDRWVHQFLTQMKLICDRVVILDDASTDNTADICESYGFEVHENTKNLWETNELEARQYLWDKTIEDAEIGDWILCLDADELFVPEHIEFIKHQIKALETYACNSVGFKLYDMWSDTHYRSDYYWQSHYQFWAMFVKLQDIEYKWLDKKLHCGRFPINSADRCIPTYIPIKHMGWSKPHFRQMKYERYMRVDPKGENGILEQYKSILDKTPNLIEF
jgi:glycosyltransferase involved in cell wall biosynthesis